MKRNTVLNVVKAMLDTQNGVDQNTYNAILDLLQEFNPTLKECVMMRVICSETDSSNKGKEFYYVDEDALDDLFENEVVTTNLPTITETQDTITESILPTTNNTKKEFRTDIIDPEIPCQ